MPKDFPILPVSREIRSHKEHILLTKSTMLRHIVTTIYKDQRLFI